MTTSDSSNDSTSGEGGFIDSAIEKGGDFVDNKTGNKYESQVDKGQDFLTDKYGNSKTADQSDQADKSSDHGN